MPTYTVTLKSHGGGQVDPRRVGRTRTETVDAASIVYVGDTELLAVRFLDENDVEVASYHGTYFVSAALA